MAGEINLDALDSSQLLELRKRIDRAIESFEERAQKAMIAELDQIARRYGYVLDDLAELLASRNRGFAVKYANPENARETWSGRGRKPKWVVDALESGKKLKELEAA